MLTAGADPLRDEGDEYAARLKEAGVAVTYRHFPGQFHGFFTMGKLLQSGQCRGQRNRRLAEGAELKFRQNAIVFRYLFAVVWGAYRGLL